MGKFVDIAGQRYGRLVASSKEVGSKRWCCVCDCGGMISVYPENLKRGRTTSCGCLRKEYLANPIVRVIHGHASRGRSPTYIVYTGMVQRTTDANASGWPKYGGRGIKTCARWLHGDGARGGFECFLEDMGERPAERTLDRIDSNGNYEPDNCRWADWHTQSKNRCTTKLTDADVVHIRTAVARGETKAGVAKRMGVHHTYVGQIIRGERRAQG